MNVWSRWHTRLSREFFTVRTVQSTPRIQKEQIRSWNFASRPHFLKNRNLWFQDGGWTFSSPSHTHNHTNWGTREKSIRRIDWTHSSSIQLWGPEAIAYSLGWQPLIRGVCTVYSDRRIIASSHHFFKTAVVVIWVLFHDLSFVSPLIYHWQFWIKRFYLLQLTRFDFIDDAIGG